MVEFQMGRRSKAGQGKSFQSNHEVVLEPLRVDRSVTFLS